MSTIFAGNTTTTSLVQTGDISGNLVLSSIGNIVLSPGTGYGVVWANNAAFSSGGSGGLTWAAVQTANVTAVVNTGYPIDTTSSNITVTLPSTVASGSLIQLVDYAQTWGIKPVTVYPNGLKINGNTSNVTLSYSSQSVGIVYVDSTKGWVGYTGFTSTPVGTYNVDYLVVAAGGGGGSGYGQGGGGAGGLLTSSAVVTPGTSYSITIGAGGAGSPSGSGGWATQRGASGANSSISNIATSIGGGGGAASAVGGGPGLSGGSGGGGGWPASSPGGAGTVGQGNPGGAGASAANYGGGGGGGASGTGGNGSSTAGGNGGAGSSSSISGSSVNYAGGGGGCLYDSAGQTANAGGAGGIGGGGPGGVNSRAVGTAGTTNTGGGGGASGGYEPTTFLQGASGGSGIVIIRYIGTQRATGGTITSSGGYTVHSFTSSGTFVA